MMVTWIFKFQTANGDELSTTCIGNIRHSLPLNHVFYSPHLANDLHSIEQHVEDKCTILFSSFGCLVQDQESGKVIGKGPKCGTMFPLHITASSKDRTLFSLFSSSLNNDHHLCHKHLGHPNTVENFVSELISVWPQNRNISADLKFWQKKKIPT